MKKKKKKKMTEKERKEKMKKIGKDSKPLSDWFDKQNKKEQTLNDIMEGL